MRFVGRVIPPGQKNAISFSLYMRNNNPVGSDFYTYVGSALLSKILEAYGSKAKPQGELRNYSQL